MESTLQEALRVHTECRAVLHTVNRRLHDRDCRCNKKLYSEPTSKFALLNHVTVATYHSADICPRCIRKLAIRNGLRSSPKYMQALWHFFDEAGASTYDLRRLFLVNEGTLEYVDRDTVEIRVREDVWQVVLVDGRLQLYHRNYATDEDGFRQFRDGFHRQRVNDAWDTDSFGEIARIIWAYDFHKHTRKQNTKMSKAAKQNS